jgi:hexosaminidase
MKFKFLAALLLFSGYLKAQNLNIIPQPRSVVNTTGQISINNRSAIGASDTSLTALAIYFQKELFKVKGLSLDINNEGSRSLIKLILTNTNTNQTIGAYSLKITPDRITIAASNKEGIFYGLISLLQIIKNQPKEGENITLASTDVKAAGGYQTITLASAEITDAPRYQWRGLMLDESRHFFGKEKVKQLLDWMAYYKLNKFHWHLTDVQGWRIEIKKYPKLSAVGAIGNYSDTSAEAKFYTQNDIKEIVAYAAQRFITVIPEIDMPGHATAANRAYPEYSGGSVSGYPNFTFNPAKEETYQYLANIIKEINALFPAKMMHLGGDEVVLGIKAWSLDTAIARMMQTKNFADVGELERYFFKRMTDTVTSLGSKILAWDEAAQTDLPAGKTIIFWWRQNLPGQLTLAMQKNYQVVLCPRLPLYFDFLQDGDHIAGRKWNGVFNRVTDVYNFPDRQLSADQLTSSQIIGVQANIWTEKIASEKRLDFMLFPRIAGLAEAAWTAPEIKNEAAFNERLKTDLKNWDKDNIYYFNPFDPLAHPEAVDFVPIIKKTYIAGKGSQKHSSKKVHSKASKKHKSSIKTHKASSKATKSKVHKKRK